MDFLATRGQNNIKRPEPTDLNLFQNTPIVRKDVLSLSAIFILPRLGKVEIDLLAGKADSLLFRDATVLHANSSLQSVYCQ